MEAPLTPFSVTGGTWPANIWARFASEALEGVPYGELATIDGDAYVEVAVDTSTGFLAGPLCPIEKVHPLRMPLGSAPSIICPIHNPNGLSDGLDANVAPTLVGMDLTAAVSLLTRLGHAATVEWADGGTIVPGSVFGQSPEPGSALLPGSSVVLTVAGPEPGRLAPAVLGLSVESARERLNATGITYRVLTLAEDDPELASSRSGMVWKQDPAGGASAAGGVTVWVNP